MCWLFDLDFVVKMTSVVKHLVSSTRRQGTSVQDTSTPLTLTRIAPPCPLPPSSQTKCETKALTLGFYDLMFAGFNGALEATAQVYLSPLAPFIRSHVGRRPG